MFDFSKPQGLECMIMESSSKADEIIAAMELAAACGEEDFDYSVDNLMPDDERRVDAAYNRLFN